MTLAITVGKTILKLAGIGLAATIAARIMDAVLRAIANV